MSETPPEEALFAKVDALLGKRLGFYAGARLPAQEDFPLLTEIVSAAKPPAAEDRHVDAALATASEKAATDAAGLPSEAEAPSAAQTEFERLASGIAAHLEVRLTELFIRQQIHLEERMRRVVREELARAAGQHEVRPPREPV